MLVYWIWFAQRKGLNCWQKQQLLQRFRDPEELYHAAPESLEPELRQFLEDRDLEKAWAICDQCRQKGIGILSYHDTNFPERLRNIEDPPMVLYFKGTLPDWQAQPIIGMVGTRKASSYGLQTAHLLGGQIAVCGGLVISGAATGVDRLSMEGALDAGKPALAVLGGGVDVVYPAGNRELYRRTEENGCLLSEYPPGSRPYPGNFLHRNRIISGISDGVLVVEAPRKSGALNTARHAFSQGRDMFAVPGNLGVDTCLGSNGLLQEGAYPALSGWDVVRHYEPLYPAAVENRMHTLQPLRQTPAMVAQEPEIPADSRKKKESPAQNNIDNLEKSTYSVINKRPVALSDEETAVLELIGTQPQLPDLLLDQAQLPAGTVQSVLTRLAIKGLVRYHPDGRISRK